MTIPELHYYERIRLLTNNHPRQTNLYNMYKYMNYQIIFFSSTYFKEIFSFLFIYFYFTAFVHMMQKKNT